MGIEERLSTQGGESNKKELTPEEITTEFFNQNYDEIARKLQGRWVFLAGTEKQILLTRVQPWAKRDMGKRYQAINELDAGDMWTFPLQIGGRKPMRQSLIAAKDGGEVGACVRIVRASYYDPEKDNFVLMEREGDLAHFLGLEDFQVSKLRFLDDSDVLCLVPGRKQMGTTEKKPINPEEANRELEKFLKE